MEKPPFEQPFGIHPMDAGMTSLFTTDTGSYLNLSEADEIELLVHLYLWLTSGCEMASAEREHIDYVLNRFDQGRNPTTADLQAIQAGLTRCGLPQPVIPIDCQGEFRADDAGWRQTIHKGVRREFG